MAWAKSPSTPEEIYQTKPNQPNQMAWEMVAAAVQAKLSFSKNCKQTT